jgi:hypothetical protein
MLVPSSAADVWEPVNVSSADPNQIANIKLNKVFASSLVSFLCGTLAMNMINLKYFGIDKILLKNYQIDVIDAMMTNKWYRFDQIRYFFQTL